MEKILIEIIVVFILWTITYFSYKSSKDLKEARKRVEAVQDSLKNDVHQTFFFDDIAMGLSKMSPGDFVVSGNSSPSWFYQSMQPQCNVSSFLTINELREMRQVPEPKPQVPVEDILANNRSIKVE